MKKTAAEIADDVVKKLTPDEEKKNSPGRLARLGLGAGSVAASVGAYKGARKLYGELLHDKLVSRLTGAETPLSRGQTNETLSALLRSSGVSPSEYSVHHLPGFDNAAFVPGFVGKGARALQGSLRDPELKKHMAGVWGEMFYPADPERGWKLVSDPRDHFAFDPEYTGPSVIAHEVGHASGGTPGAIFRSASGPVGALGKYLVAPGLLAGGTIANKPNAAGGVPSERRAESVLACLYRV